MGKRMTREEFLEAVFSRRYEELKGRELRTVRVRVVGKELSLAQLIGVTDRRVYENLGLHIGTHLGEDHTGQSIGLLHLGGHGGGRRRGHEERKRGAGLSGPVQRRGDPFGQPGGGQERPGACGGIFPDGAGLHRL